MNVSGGLLQNIVIGIIGSFVGSFVFNAIGFYAHGLFGHGCGFGCGGLPVYLAGAQAVSLRISSEPPILYESEAFCIFMEQSVNSAARFAVY